MQNKAEITFAEIKSLDDTLYDYWLDLYQQSFPLNEQMPVSSLNKILRNKATGEANNSHLLACLDSEKRFTALVYYEQMPDCAVAALWYLAVNPKERSQGMGSKIYEMLQTRVRAEQPAVRALFFEVQDPEICNLPEEQEDAHRRIAFYKRNGALQLYGIDYTQSVGWQPPLSMRIMVHCFENLTAAEVFALAAQVFGNTLQQNGTLELR